jgi:hypothetical protein
MKLHWREKHPESPEWVMPTEKPCSRCGVVKPIEAFHRNKSAKDGHTSACAACLTPIAAAWNKAHPEYHRQKANEYRLRHPERSRIANCD